MTQNYMICSSPRTGSTLLCELLSSTGVAGTPHSYFRAQDMAWRAAEWGLSTPYTVSDYLNALRQFTATANGVVGLRVMWGSLDGIVSELQLPQGKPDQRAQLEQALGPMRYIHLERKDLLGQAISLYRAEVSDYWHSTQTQAPRRTASYNFDEIARRIDSLRRDNAAWRQWFQEHGMIPFSLSYEELDANPIQSTEKLLQYLELDYDVSRISAPNQKLADQSTERWRARYLAEAQNAQ